MTKEKISQKKNKGLKNLIPILVILIVIVGIPLLFLNYQARRSGMSMGDANQENHHQNGFERSGF